MYYWATNKQFKVETALLQFLSNLNYKNSFVYRTISAKHVDEYLKFGGAHRPKTWRRILFSYLL